MGEFTSQLRDVGAALSKRAAVEQVRTYVDIVYVRR